MDRLSRRAAVRGGAVDHHRLGGKARGRADQVPHLSRDGPRDTDDVTASQDERGASSSQGNRSGPQPIAHGDRLAVQEWTEPAQLDAHSGRDVDLAKASLHRAAPLGMLEQRFAGGRRASCDRRRSRQDWRDGHRRAVLPGRIRA